MHLVFHDYETFNLNPQGGAPSQFAASTMDYDFRNSKDHNFFCTPSDDVFPELNACLITKQTPNSVKSQPLSMTEYNFTKCILDIMTNKRETCVIGYNSCSFDDEWTRNLLYRNLFPPYEWHFKHQNSRFDAIQLMLATYALRPELLKWKFVDELDSKGAVIGNRVSMKLEDIAQKNSITHLNSHNALSDVKALTELVKMIKHSDPTFFEIVFKTRNKHYLLELLNSKQSSDGLLYISRNDKQTQFAGYVIPIAQSKKDTNVYWVWDAKVDPNDVLNLNKEQRTSLLRMKRNDLLSLGLSRKGLVKVKLNALPTLMPLECMRESDERRTGLAKMKESISKNRKNVDSQRQELTKLITEVETFCSFTKPSLNHDRNLYSGGFFNTEETLFCTEFHNKQSWESKLEFIKSSAPTERMKKMGLRVIGRNSPALLSGQDFAEWTEYVKQRLFGTHESAIRTHLNMSLNAVEELQKLQDIKMNRSDMLGKKDMKIINELIVFFTNKISQLS